MENLNSEIDDMYKMLTTVVDDEDSNAKFFDFSSIRDQFRQHIHNRRNTETSDLVLLDDQLLANLQALKQETFALLQKFRNINVASNSQQENGSKTKTFTSFEEFVSFVVNQEEILNSELWKVEAIFNYLEATEQHSPSISVCGTKEL